jgi:hypothetical protein
MFICLDCGEDFYDFDTYDDPRPYGEQTVYETFAVCPNCKSDNFSEAVKCTRCEKIIAKEDCEYDEHLNYLCEDCYEELYGE